MLGKLQHMGVYPGILRRPFWPGPTQPAPCTFPPSQVSQGFHTFTLVNLIAGPTSSIIDLCSSRRRLGRSPRCQLLHLPSLVVSPCAQWMYEVGGMGQQCYPGDHQPHIITAAPGLQPKFLSCGSVGSTLAHGDSCDNTVHMQRSSSSGNCSV